MLFFDPLLLIKSQDFSPPNPKEWIDFFKPMKKHDRFTPRHHFPLFSYSNIFAIVIDFLQSCQSLYLNLKERLPFFDILRQMSLSKERWMHDVMF